MAEIGIHKPTVEMKITMIFTEEEAAALDALTSYGDDAFLKWFYQNMGQTYLKPHEKGLRSLFKSVRAIMPYYLERARNARKEFEGLTKK